MKSRFNPAAFRKLEQKINKAVQKSLDECAAKTLEEIDNNFRSKNFFGDKWEANTLGTPTLVKSANLKNSVRILSKTKNMRRVGTTVDYANIHNFGGTFKPSARQQKYFWAMYRKTKNPMYKNTALKLKKGLSIKIPKRQFIGYHKKLDKYFQYIIKRNFKLK